jgi:hypothetical protein
MVTGAKNNWKSYLSWITLEALAGLEKGESEKAQDQG